MPQDAASASHLPHIARNLSNSTTVRGSFPGLMLVILDRTVLSILGRIHHRTLQSDTTNLTPRYPQK